MVTVITAGGAGAGAGAGTNSTNNGTGGTGTGTSNGNSNNRTKNSAKNKGRNNKKGTNTNTNANSGKKNKVIPAMKTGISTNQTSTITVNDAITLTEPLIDTSTGTNAGTVLDTDFATTGTVPVTAPTTTATVPVTAPTTTSTSATGSTDNTYAFASKPTTIPIDTASIVSGEDGTFININTATKPTSAPETVITTCNNTTNVVATATVPKEQQQQEFTAIFQPYSDIPPSTTTTTMTNNRLPNLVLGGSPTNLKSLGNKNSSSSSHSFDHHHNNSSNDPTNQLTSTTTSSSSSTTSELFWLLLCFVGIMASFVAYGLLLEYTTSGGRKLHELSFLFITSGLYTLTAAAGRYVRDETPTTIPPARFAILGLTSMGSTFCSVRSLRYVIFPIQVLAKSCKPVPVMLMGALMGKKYPLRKYINVALIVGGVALFMGGGDQKKKGSSAGAEGASGTAQLFGLLLLFISLCFDGGTGAYEDKLMSVHSVQPFDLMFNIQLGKTILAGIGLLVLNQMHVFIQMIQDMGFLLVALGLTGALGQVFIFITIAKFGALTCSIIGLARKVTTLVASIWYFGHHINTIQFIGLAISVLSMVMDFFGKKKGGGKHGSGGHHHNSSGAHGTTNTTSSSSSSLLGGPPLPPSEELKKILDANNDDDDDDIELAATAATSSSSNRR